MGYKKIDRPEYGTKIQYVKEDDTESLMDYQIKYLQQVLGKFLYYTRFIDNTMLHALNDIVTAVSKGTKEIEQAVTYFMHYAYSNLDAEIIYRASDMILQSYSGAVYLVAPKSCSYTNGYHYLGSKDGQLFNGLVLVMAKVIRNVLELVLEGKIVALIMNEQILIPARQTLENMGHK